MIPCPYSNQTVALVAAELERREQGGDPRLLNTPDAAVLMDFLTETGNDHLWSVIQLWTCPNRDTWLCWIALHEVGKYSSNSKTKSQILDWVADPTAAYRSHEYFGAPENLRSVSRAIAHLLDGFDYATTNPCWRLYPVIAAAHGF